MKIIKNTGILETDDMTEGIVYFILCNSKIKNSIFLNLKVLP